MECQTQRKLTIEVTLVISVSSRVTPAQCLSLSNWSKQYTNFALKSLDEQTVDQTVF